MLTQFILKKTSVSRLNILRIAAEKNKSWVWPGYLRNVFDVDKLPFHRRRRIVFDIRKYHFIELRSWYMLNSVFIHFDGCFKRFKNTLLIQHRSKNDGHIRKRSYRSLNFFCKLFGRIFFFVNEGPTYLQQ